MRVHAHIGVRAGVEESAHDASVAPHYRPTERAPAVEVLRVQQLAESLSTRCFSYEHMSGVKSAIKGELLCGIHTYSYLKKCFSYVL